MPGAGAAHMVNCTVLFLAIIAVAATGGSRPTRQHVQMPHDEAAVIMDMLSAQHTD